MKIINLALRSEFTFGQVFQKVEHITVGQEVAVGIADLNNTQAHIALRNRCKESNIKPIFGLRVIVVDSPKQKPKNPGQHGDIYILLAKNVDGLRELYKLVKVAYSNFHYRPLVGVLDIFKLSENVIVIAEGFKLEERIDYLALTTTTRSCMLEYDLPHVAINNNFYPRATDKQTFQLMLGKNKMTNQTYPQHILSTDEWLRFWPNEHDAIKNTHVIADMCNVELPIAENVKFRGRVTLEDLCEKGIKDRNYKMTAERKVRLKRELKLINDKNYQDYFLVVADMVAKAKEEMLVGHARGSAAGSLVCYLIGITEVDPLEFDLLFERFIDINRHDMPDIDIDFPDKYRDKVITELEESNGGDDYVAHVGTVSRMRGKSIVNHAMKELNIKYEDAENLKQSLIQRPAGDKRVGSCVIDTLNETDVGKKFLDKYPAMSIVAKFENHATHFGTHSGGIFVCNDPLTHYVGVNSRENMCMIDYREAEEINLLKIDVLGLRTLAVLQETAEHAGFDYEKFYNLDWSDDKVFELFRNGRLNGVFQFEGQALKGLCRRIKVESFEDISAITALGRPGPLKGGGTERYVARHSGNEPVTFICDHPAIIENTKETYGVLVYQEQLMFICRGLGMSWEETSHFRKVVSKRQGMEKLGKFKDIFTKAAKSEGLSDMDIERTWDYMITFGNYGFNKSHSVAYAMLSYACAWAKAYYPLEFAVANMNNAKSDDEAIRLLRDLVRHDGIEYRTVDPDESEVNWIISEDKKLLGGLTNIDGIGVSKAKTIVRNRKNNKPDSPSIIKKLIRPKTVFDILFPCHHWWEYYYEDNDICDIEEIGGKGTYTFIGRIMDFKIRDLNSDDQIEKRGSRFDNDSLALNITVEDDTDSIMARINRQEFEDIGIEVMDREENKKDNWYAIKGNIIDDDMRFIFINVIEFLGST